MKSDQPLGTKTVTCNGELIRKYRQRLGWSQAVLADKVGYSERLIRKAEADGVLRTATVIDIADALSDDDVVVSPLDLASNPLLACQKVIRAYCDHHRLAVAHCRDVLDESIVAIGHNGPVGEVHADEAHGIEAFDRMINAALDLFDPIKSDFGRWFVDGNRVICIRQETMCPVGGTKDQQWTAWYTHEFLVRHGKVVRVDTYADEMAWEYWTRVSKEIKAARVAKKIRIVS